MSPATDKEGLEMRSFPKIFFLGALCPVVGRTDWYVSFLSFPLETNWDNNGINEPPEKKTLRDFFFGSVLFDVAAWRLMARTESRPRH